ncbi:MAG: ABC transporter permease [Phycisphaerae bacterium]
MSVLLQDVRFAVRTLIKAPGFVIVATITLALAIGANTAMFSLVNTAIFGPLPFEDGDRLMRVFRQAGEEGEIHFFSYPDYREYRDRSDVFEEFIACSFVPVSVGSGEQNETRFGQIVSGNYFAALGVDAIEGRMLTPADDQTPGAHPVVVISYAYWQRVYGGRPGAVGETIALSGHPFTVVGIAPKGFSGALPIPSPELWVPMMMLGQIRPDSADQLEDPAQSFLWVLGKLQSDLPVPQAQARLAVTASQMKEIDPERYENEYAVLVPADGIIPMTPGMRHIALTLSALVMSMVGLVLIVGCANVANLLLARSSTRRKELGIRLAIGASRLRVVRQLLTESVLLALLGGAAGLLLATWTVNLLVACLPDMPFGISVDLRVGIDHRVLIFTGGVSVLTGIVFGMLPAIAVTGKNLAAAIKDAGSATGLSLKRSRLHSALVVGQVAVSLVLLIGAGLFVRSLMSAKAIDPGFHHQNVLSVALDLGSRDYDSASAKVFYEQLLQRARALPGVISASIEDCPPLTMAMSSTDFWIEDRPYTSPDEERVSVAFSTVSSDNFTTLSVPLLRGRDFSAQDTENSPGVAIVNRAFADRYWPGQDPLGKRISREGAEGPFLEVVGVSKTVKHWLIGEEPRPYIYVPLTQNYRADFATLLVRTSSGPMAALPAVREALREVDPNMSPWGAQSMTSLVSFAVLPAKFAAVLFGLLGLLALLLASTGLYGVMSYAVTQRTHEIGVRMAIGARHGDVVRLVLRRGLALTGAGLGVGLLLAVASTRVLSSMLYEISATDPATFVSVCVLLAMVALSACYIPAHRATKVDPMVALRCE